MLKWLTGKQPIPVWVIKQIDDSLLHLCGQGSVEPRAKRSSVVECLHAGRYEGAVTMACGGLVLNARLFAALVPLESLQLDEQGHAHWNGRSWYVAQVPQRCWTFEGRLVSQRQVLGNQEQLISVEDVSDIRRQLQGASAPGRVNYDPRGVNEHPLIARRDVDDAAVRNDTSRGTDKWRGHDD
ncbi:hypothetical protein HOP62_04340 [Halomonas sp. MCCC 1A17488]|uniref:Uncharacterized protein n=1 Tax=Billgrantia sulfidoxydans TaxID=2733484 RepID=A0ABX7W470_9GAMM|nr:MULTISPECIES: hypothetical protein [Halomonas]MCE8015303.1 hypothetical protein [Halomonas sp. MCCC 1A17488]MCG3238636.1 hypothetical protein [Halomonas sp. MCCC 1A17488]QPP51388.1 hypothetical protein I4484_10060 [Halomonas sp. SS10-MC5]QTP54940.1 hypothetical protein HNO51_09770 [Halomonas sulfidoxydans]